MSVTKEENWAFRDVESRCIRLVLPCVSTATVEAGISARPDAPDFDPFERLSAPVSLHYSLVAGP